MTMTINTYNAAVARYNTLAGQIDALSTKEDEREVLDALREVRYTELTLHIQRAKLNYDWTKLAARRVELARTVATVTITANGRRMCVTLTDMIRQNESGHGTWQDLTRWAATQGISEKELRAAALTMRRGRRY